MFVQFTQLEHMKKTTLWSAHLWHNSKLNGKNSFIILKIWTIYGLDIYQE